MFCSEMVISLEADHQSQSRYEFDEDCLKNSVLVIHSDW